jgi:hypothetical protein
MRHVYIYRENNVLVEEYPKKKKKEIILRKF